MTTIIAYRKKTLLLNVVAVGTAKMRESLPFALPRP